MPFPPTPTASFFAHSHTPHNYIESKQTLEDHLNQPFIDGMPLPPTTKATGSINPPKGAPNQFCTPKHLSDFIGMPSLLHYMAFEATWQNYGFLQYFESAAVILSKDLFAPPPTTTTTTTTNKPRSSNKQDPLSLPVTTSYSDSKPAHLAYEARISNNKFPEYLEEITAVFRQKQDPNPAPPSSTYSIYATYHETKIPNPVVVGLADLLQVRAPGHHVDRIIEPFFNPPLPIGRHNTTFLQPAHDDIVDDDLDENKLRGKGKSSGGQNSVNDSIVAKNNNSNNNNRPNPNALTPYNFVLHDIEKTHFTANRPSRTFQRYRTTIPNGETTKPHFGTHVLHILLSGGTPPLDLFDLLAAHGMSLCYQYPSAPSFLTQLEFIIDHCPINGPALINILKAETHRLGYGGGNHKNQKQSHRPQEEQAFEKTFEQLSLAIRQTYEDLRMVPVYYNFISHALYKRLHSVSPAVFRKLLSLGEQYPVTVSIVPQLKPQHLVDLALFEHQDYARSLRVFAPQTSIENAKSSTTKESKPKPKLETRWGNIWSHGRPIQIPSKADQDFYAQVDNAIANNRLLFVSSSSSPKPSSPSSQPQSQSPSQPHSQPSQHYPTITVNPACLKGFDVLARLKADEDRSGHGHINRHWWSVPPSPWLRFASLAELDYRIILSENVASKSKGLRPAVDVAAAASKAGAKISGKATQQQKQHLGPETINDVLVEFFSELKLRKRWEERGKKLEKRNNHSNHKQINGSGRQSNTHNNNTHKNKNKQQSVPISPQMHFCGTTATKSTANSNNNNNNKTKATSLTYSLPKRSLDRFESLMRHTGGTFASVPKDGDDVYYDDDDDGDDDEEEDGGWDWDCDWDEDYEHDVGGGEWDEEEDDNDEDGLFYFDETLNRMVFVDTSGQQLDHQADKESSGPQELEALANK